MPIPASRLVNFVETWRRSGPRIDQLQTRSLLRFAETLQCCRTPFELAICQTTWPRLGHSANEVGHSIRPNCRKSESAGGTSVSGMARSGPSSRASGWSGPLRPWVAVPMAPTVPTSRRGCGAVTSPVAWGYPRRELRYRRGRTGGGLDHNPRHLVHWPVGA
jgi:hypothetical protein